MFFTILDLEKTLPYREVYASTRMLIEKMKYTRYKEKNSHKLLPSKKCTVNENRISK